MIIIKELNLPKNIIGERSFTRLLKDGCGLSYKKNNYTKPSMEDPVT